MWCVDGRLRVLQQRSCLASRAHQMMSQTKSQSQCTGEYW